MFIWLSRERPGLRTTEKATLSPGPRDPAPVHPSAAGGLLFGKHHRALGMSGVGESGGLIHRRAHDVKVDDATAYHPAFEQSTETSYFTGRPSHCGAESP